MLLQSLITTETVQVSTEKLPPRMVMSPADIQDQDICRKKSYQFTGFPSSYLF
jgi:hypothetical protein